jgi:hypothetical protein
MRNGWHCTKHEPLPFQKAAFPFDTSKCTRRQLHPTWNIIKLMIFKTMEVLHTGSGYVPATALSHLADFPYCCRAYFAYQIWWNYKYTTANHLEGSQ